VDFGDFFSGITTESESQFAYRLGKTHASYNFPDFTPLFESSFAAEDLAKAKSTCGEQNKQCIYDLLLSADESFALGTLTAFDDFHDVTAIAGKIYYRFVYSTKIYSKNR
jgi:hypothetical protein